MSGDLQALGQDLIAADPSGRLHGSRDGGESWALWEDGPPTPSGVLLC